MSVVFGCAQTRVVTIATTPVDAIIRIDGLPQGHGPVTHEFAFATPSEVHRINATRIGYQGHTEVITLDTAKRNLKIDLKPQQATVNLTVKPAPAVLTIDGKRVSDNPVSFYSSTMEFSVDSKNDWTTHTVLAERPNFQPTTLVVSWVDRDQNYTIHLEPMKKDLSITSNPSGATIYLDEELIGTTPLKVPGRAFPVDLETNEFIPQKLKAVKPGYGDAETQISWDDARSDYSIDLPPRSKTVKIKTDPPDAIVRIEGQEVPRDGSGAAVSELKFLPINEAGDPRSFVVTAIEKGSNGDWEPATFNIGWDDGKTDYTIHLKEIQTRNVPLVTAMWLHDDGAWTVEPHTSDSLGRKDITDGGDRMPAVLVAHVPKGAMIDSFAISPDGMRLLYTVFTGKTKGDFRSQMFVVHTDGSGGEDVLSDGKSLDLTPSFSPAGDQVVFSSNRGGKRMNIWQMSSTGAQGITQLTRDEANDLWPVIDTDPRPRLYYQSMIDNRVAPGLFSILLGSGATGFRTDMQIAGMQPRISPKNDALVFTWIDDKTGKRDLYRVTTAGGRPQNLTATPDIDESDPVWNRDGSKIAFASDRGVDPENRRNLDIWVIDAHKPGLVQQITTNGSQDDSPVWDPVGSGIYFRSNRGGEWGVWRIAVK